MSVFQATIGGRFAPLAMLVNEDADLDSMVIHFNKAVNDTAVDFLGKQRRKRKPWVTPETLDLCDQRRDMKKKRGEPEGDKDYREIKKKIGTEMQKRFGYTVSARKWNLASIRMTARKHTSKSWTWQPYKTNRGSVSQRTMKSLTGGQSTAQTMRLIGT